jgi:glyoxylase-like metal-dependent hydrolase (beta-lactamase superfamily II)
MTSKKICNSWFTTQEIDHGMYLITEPYYFSYNRANMWLIKGQNRDLLVDTGLGVASLRQHLAGLIDKPLLAVASHIHFDHAGGIHEFDERAIHAAEVQALREGNAHESLCSQPGWLHYDHFECLPYSGFTIQEYTFNASEPTQILQDGDVIDLGDRALEVLHLPGHSAGCIALYDHRSQELFSGDVIYDGDLLDELPCSNIFNYIQTYERLQKLPVNIVYPGHYKAFGQERYLEILGEYLDRRRQPGCPASTVCKSLLQAQ